MVVCLCGSGNFYMDVVAIISLVEAPVELLFTASNSCAQWTLSGHNYYTFSR